MANEKQAWAALEAAQEVGAAFLKVGTQEMVRLQQALDATEEEVARLQMVRDAAERERVELRGWLAALEAWASNVIAISEDRRIPSADVLVDGQAITAEARKIIAG